MEKDAEIYRGKKERIKSIALKAKKESSDDETSTSKSDDEEYARAVRNFKKFFRRKGKFVRQPKEEKKSFRQKDKKKGKSDRKCFRCGDPNHLIGNCPKPPRKKIKRPSLKVLGAIAKMTSRTKLMMKLVSWLNHQMRKQAHASHKAKNMVSTKRCLELLHMDLFAPSEIKSYGGYSPNSKAYIVLNKHTMKVKESLNVTFDESPPPTKLSPLVDDDVGGEQAIINNTKVVNNNNKKDEAIEVDEIVNIKESKDHLLDQVIGNLNQRTLRIVTPSSIVENNMLLFFQVVGLEPFLTLNEPICPRFVAEFYHSLEVKRDEEESPYIEFKLGQLTLKLTSSQLSRTLQTPYALETFYTTKGSLNSLDDYPNSSFFGPKHDLIKKNIITPRTTQTQLLRDTNKLYLDEIHLDMKGWKLKMKRIYHKWTKIKQNRQNRAREWKEHEKTKPKARSKQIVDPELRNIVETPVVTMADTRTMSELLQAPTKGYRDAIVIPAILAKNFELKVGLLSLVTSRAAQTCLEKEPPRSIHTWKDLVSKFVNYFFPPSKTRNLKNNITNFFKKFDETFSEAWDRFKDLLRKCPHHSFSELHQIDTFYNSLTQSDQESLNVAAGDITALTDMVKELVLMNKANQQAFVKAIEETCMTCGSLHPTMSVLLPIATILMLLQPRGPTIKETNPKPSISYPSRLNDQKLREKANNQMLKFFQIFQRLHFDISFVDALLHMPKFASTFKSLLSNKEKLFELASTPLNENCSAVLLKKLPEKLGDPDKFFILCDFLKLEECFALADLGASINLMPLYVWKKLSLLKLTRTRMTLELANRSVAISVGVTEDVFVKVRKFYFLVDFVVVDYNVDTWVPLILGRP
nr:reverse transcriptase domain-containing protein [Tanacetum cinerariifolium]